MMALPVIDLRHEGYHFYELHSWQYVSNRT